MAQVFTPTINNYNGYIEHSTNHNGFFLGMKLTDDQISLLALNNTTGSVLYLTNGNKKIGIYHFENYYFLGVYLGDGFESMNFITGRKNRKVFVALQEEIKTTFTDLFGIEERPKPYTLSRNGDLTTPQIWGIGRNL